MAVWTGLEPATSAVTGRHSNQLNYQTNILMAETEGFEPSRQFPDLLPSRGRKKLENKQIWPCFANYNANYSFHFSTLSHAQ